MNVTFYDWHYALQLKKKDPPFYALLACLILRADSDNLALIRSCFPREVDETQKRYDGPGGAIDEEERETVDRLRKVGEMNVLGELTKQLI